MSEQLPSDQTVRRLLMDALVSYSDACTLPLLTPSCPYYRSGSDGPVCGEECRTIVASYGAAHRPVTSHQIGGLILIGRELPTTSAAGTTAFDAAEEYIKLRHLPVTQQSTACLVMSLRAALIGPLFPSRRGRSEPLEPIWAELARRGVAVARLARGGLAGTSAVAVAVWVLHLLQNEVAEGGAEFLATDGSWLQVVRQQYAEWVSTVPDRQERDHYLRQHARVLRELSGTELDDGTLVDTLPEAVFAATPWFHRRAAAWFYYALSHSPGGGYDPTQVRPELFDGLPIATVPDSAGRWVYQRFTMTELRRWASESLTLELRSQRGEGSEACSPRVLAERAVPLEELKDLILDRQVNRFDNAPEPSDEGLQAGMFVEKAKRLLRGSNHEGAAQVFSALLSLYPTDPMAWNNLAFCQLPVDPVQALESLDMATMFARATLLVPVANRVLALHLLARDEEATQTARAGLALQESDTHAAVMWSIADAPPLTLVEVAQPRTYLTDLLAHIERSIAEK